jgi:hypothetical protein
VWSLVALAVVVVAGTGCGASRPPARTTLTSDSVGPLTINRSDRAQVIAFAGQPTSEFRGVLYHGLRLPRVDALYYGCHYPAANHSRSAEGTCKTIFWLDARTGKLADFWTRDPRYTTAGGVGVGTSTAAAERATHRRAEIGCGGAALPLGNRITYSNLVLWISGSRVGLKLHPIGGHIDYIWLIGNDRGMELQC